MVHFNHRSLCFEWTLACLQSLLGCANYSPFSITLTAVNVVYNLNLICSLQQVSAKILAYQLAQAA